ncbi:MAG TPA: 50S ribosomal protein L18 [Candidatus Vogelbacteria bacterium]|nr:50S ribosomal protein L18 [Candidatus Vogelbacteria bacterium]
MKDKEKTKRLKRENRHRRIRAKISGRANKPRLVVFRSNKDIYASLIDDDNGKVLMALSSRQITDKEIKEISKIKEIPKADFKKQIKSFAVGFFLAGQAKKKDIIQVVFDRGGYIYTGRVKALAEGARIGGLKF